MEGLHFRKKESKCKFQVKAEIVVYTGVKWDSPRIIFLQEFLRIRYRTRRTKLSFGFCFNVVLRKQGHDFLLCNNHSNGWCLPALRVLTVSKTAPSKAKVFLLAKKAVMLAVTLVKATADFLSLHSERRCNIKEKKTTTNTGVGLYPATFQIVRKICAYKRLIIKESWIP